MRIQRHLAPTAAPVSFEDVTRAVLGLVRGKTCRAWLEEDLKRYFGVKHVFLFTSGKAALATTILALAAGSSRRKVVIPAYTCYTVPSAIIRGGGQVALCDVDPHTLDYVFDDLKRVVDQETLCVVVPHLLGQVANVQRVKEIAAPYGAYVVEDAAQAMGGKQADRFLGTQADIGFFSLGRGKNVSAGSGGILFTQSGTIAAAIQSLYQDLPTPSLGKQLLNIATMAATIFLIRPGLYWLPAGLPFLGLGETHFDLAFPVQRMDGSRAGLLLTWRQRLERSNEERRTRTHDYEVYLSSETLTFPPIRSAHSVYLRFPLVLPTAEQKAALCGLGTARGLGISGLYPEPISEISALRPGCKGQRFPGAEILARRMVTLPAHHFVEQKDVIRACSAVREVVDSEVLATRAEPAASRQTTCVSSS